VLADSFGRTATDLRVSLTDRCNLRCADCMPPEGLDWLPGPDVLTGDEVVRSAPAETFLVNDGPGRVGIIGSVTRPSCGACDRARLTADGQVRNCLFAPRRKRPAHTAASRRQR
jgi:molybdenum cofactor biosynthesis enzyme MoaA